MQATHLMSTFMQAVALQVKMATLKNLKLKLLITEQEYKEMESKVKNGFLELV